MEGWEVVTPDEKTVGRVVAETDDYLIVEHGLLIKSRHPVPKAFATAREEQRQISVTLPKELVHDAPKVRNGDFDREAADQHYGLAGAMPGSPTEGYGDIDRDDPGWSAEREAEAAGRLPPEEERARTREGKHEERRPSSPGLLGERKIP
jgi:hypothetical protein